MKTDDNRCLECGTKLIGRNAIDVGYCIPCYNMMMADDGSDDDEQPEYYHCCTCGKTAVNKSGIECPINFDSSTCDVEEVG